MKTISAALLAQPIEGRNLTHTILGNELGNRPHVLIFLRHFGCIFCREVIADIRKAAHSCSDFPSVYFFYQGTVEDGREFFDSLWPESRAVADLPKLFYNGFGLERGSVGQMFGPEVWACGIRAVSKGHFIGAPVGDPWVMPGFFLVQGNRILWTYTPTHAGDHPAFSEFPEMVLRLASTAPLDV